MCHVAVVSPRVAYKNTILEITWDAARGTHGDWVAGVGEGESVTGWDAIMEYLNDSGWKVVEVAAQRARPVTYAMDGGAPLTRCRLFLRKDLTE
jgi:hypothetical protein